MPEIITPGGWERVLGPVRSVPTVRLRDREGGGYDRWLENGCVTVGNRVMAHWQRFGHLLGNGTVVAFERATGRVRDGITVYPEGWIKVVVDYDYNNSYDVEKSHDGFVRWDFDRTIVVPGRFSDESQEESVARKLRHMVEQGQRR